MEVGHFISVLTNGECRQGYLKETARQKYICPDPTGTCILETDIGDGKNDCLSGADEENLDRLCSRNAGMTVCGPDYKKSLGRKCTYRSSVTYSGSDYRFDCQNGWHATQTAVETICDGQEWWLKGEKQSPLYPCGDINRNYLPRGLAVTDRSWSKRCVLSRQMGDGIIDCLNGYDESRQASCEFPSGHSKLNDLSCGTGSLQSANMSQCISVDEVLNGYNDCSNGYDEDLSKLFQVNRFHRVLPVPCSFDKDINIDIYKAPYIYRMVSGEKIGDGKIDCWNSADEINVKNLCSSTFQLSQCRDLTGKENNLRQCIPMLYAKEAERYCLGVTGGKQEAADRNQIIIYIVAGVGLFIFILLIVRFIKNAVYLYKLRFRVL